MAATELVTVQHHHASSPRQVRISKRVKVAIDHMVHRGQKRADAAKTAGITDEAMRKAMHKPEVLVYLDTQQQVLRTSAKARSISRIDNLADDATSEHVKLESNKFLLGIEGVSPISKSESVIDHKGLQPGLVMNLIIGAVQQPDALLIDGQTHEQGSRHVINGLPQPVPHPSMRNALPKPALPGDSQVSAKAPRGEK